MARKISGGKYKKARKKKLFERIGVARKVEVGKTRKKVLRGLGGNLKTILLSAEKANVFDPKTKKSKVTKIISVTKVPSNRYLKNVLVKGSIIQTEIGEARVTNRPSQEGTVNAVLI